MTILGLRDAFGVPTTPAWRRFIAHLLLKTDADCGILRDRLDLAMAEQTHRIQINEMRAILLSLEVIKEDRDRFTIDPARAERVSMVLEILDEERIEKDVGWEVIATIPDRFRDNLPEGFTSTKACMLALIAKARREIWFATPFMDFQAIAFLADPLRDALERGVSLKILTTENNKDFTDGLIDVIGPQKEHVTVWEASTVSSLLGTHAKAIVVDGSEAYLGSANTTSYGLMHHFELGTRLWGPAVRGIVKMLEIIAREGRIRDNIVHEAQR